MTTLNIRNVNDRDVLTSQGWQWVTVVPRGERTGAVRSRHRTYEAARKAAANKDRDILEVAEASMY